MTVNSITSRVSYAGDGATTVFVVPFYFLDPYDLVVIIRNADGSESLQAYTTNYSVANALNPAGGSITMFSPPVLGSTVFIIRDPPLLQGASYVDGARFPAQSHMNTVDNNVMMEQRTRDLVLKSMRLRETDASGNDGFQALGRSIEDVSVLGFQPLTGFPLSPSEGDTVYVSASHLLFTWDGTGWRPISLTLAVLTAIIAGLPTTLPATPGVLWLNGGMVSLS